VREDGGNPLHEVKLSTDPVTARARAYRSEQLFTIARQFRQRSLQFRHSTDADPQTSHVSPGGSAFSRPFGSASLDDFDGVDMLGFRGNDVSKA
jgi:hypothetical protein